MDDPLGVRRAALRMMTDAQHVHIDDEAVQAVGATFEQTLHVPAWNHAYHFGDGGARTANYILLLDALNFSFWGEPRWGIDYHGEALNGYWALAAALKRAIEDGFDLTDARVLARMDEPTLGRVLAGRGSIPLLAERTAHAREVGSVLLEQFDGQFTNLVESAGWDAAGVARRVIECFSSFRDAPVYHGRVVPIYKRAQIVAADLYGAFDGKGWGALAGIERLTCFADYKLPQILRRWGVLCYTAELANRVDAQVELAAGSDEEIEIRALTIAAVERLRAALATRGIALNSVQVDWALWDAAQGQAPDGKPYHHTRSIYY